LMIAVGLVLTPLTAQLWVLLIALGLLSFGSGINNPCNQSLLSKLAPDETAGGVLGLGQSLATLGRILGPIIGCTLFNRVGMVAPYLVGAAVMVLVIALSMALPRLKPGTSMAH